jgi:hypothetical protein
MPKRSHSLSVTVITKNEEDRLSMCLESVQELADEIIILDSGSTDLTVEVASRYTDQVFITDWPGYGRQKQRALEKASCEWVLAIDADEVLTPELRTEIAAMLDADPPEVGFRLPWAVTIFGKRLDHGQSARAPLRLFRREGARFTESLVHETVLLPAGKVGRMKGRLLHYTHRHFGETLYKNAHYGWLGAQQRHAAGRTGGGLVGASLRGIAVFFHVYILRGGFLDGGVGFLMAAMYSQVAFNKYAGLWTLNRQDRLAATQETHGRQSEPGM